MPDVPDFSYIKEDYYRPSMVTRRLGEGAEVTDDMLLEVYNRINPPLLNDRQSAVVTAILARKRGRRPSRGVPSLKWLARHIVRLDRPEVDPEFLNLLAERVVSTNGPTDFERRYPLYKSQLKRDRRAIIGSIYRDIYALLEGGPTVVEHHILGKIDVPSEAGTRREQAAKMTHEQIGTRTRYIPPSIGTIIKFGSMIQ